MKKLLLSVVLIIAGLVVAGLIAKKVMTAPGSIFTTNTIVSYVSEKDVSYDDTDSAAVSTGKDTEFVSNSGKIDFVYDTDKTDITDVDETTSVSESLIGTKEAYLISVIDGDTLVLYIDGEGDRKVRLIGVDTPESVAWSEYLEKSGKKNTEEGKDASKFVTNLLDEKIDGVGGMLYVKYDVEKYDKYERILAYVYFPDGRMLQEELLETGMARTMTIAPNVSYADHFVEIQRKAQESKAGFWSGDFWNDATK